MKPRILFFTLCTAGAGACAQQQGLPLSLSLYNNGTALPGQGYLGMFSKTLHPGMEAGTRLSYRERTRSILFQTLKLGYFYHRHAQHAARLYTELGYRYRVAGGWYAEGLAGAGYLHSFPDLQQFTWENGAYRRKPNLGRPQLMASAALTAGYDLGQTGSLPLAFFLQYQFWIQAPFVNKYVPLLPNSALHIGVLYHFPRHHAQAHQP